MNRLLFWGLLTCLFGYSVTASARYIESDPLGLDGGGWSTYAYANGNPTLYVDPDGRNPLLWQAFLIGLELYGVSELPLSLADGEPEFIGAGKNSEVFRIAEDWVLKFTRVDSRTVGEMVDLTNKLADKFCQVQPAQHLAGSPFILQKYTAGVEYRDLSLWNRIKAKRQCHDLACEMSLHLGGSNKKFRRYQDPGDYYIGLDRNSFNSIYDAHGNLLTVFDAIFALPIKPDAWHRNWSQP